ncbi:MAG: sulfatase-like hydrolase/transferase [Verrucomicrobiota bacterium]
MRTLAFALTALFTCASSHANEGTHRPHVVIFISDDMGWNDVGYHGSPADTPHIDQLVAEGLELDRFYVHPICTPTRAALMTGRMPARFGITGPLSNGGDKGVPAEETFISEVFREAGYETALTGKWHLGSGEIHHPTARGFDHFYGHLSGMIDYFDHTNGNTLDWQRNGVTLREEGYSTDLIAAEAVKVIEGSIPQRPFFLIVPFNAPHGPAQAPQALVEKYEAEGHRAETATRLASIDSMDQAIGTIVGALDSKGLTHHTLVLFFCDNGAKVGKRAPAISDEGLALRGGKSELYEGGIRVPAVMRWPERIPAGTKSDSFISVLDLLPTLAAAMGIPFEPHQPLDGVNRWDQLTSNGDASGAPIIIAGQRGVMTAIEEPFKLILSGDSIPQLYNVVADPTESEDLADSHPNEVERLLAVLEPHSNLNPRGKKAENRTRKGKKRLQPNRN